MDDTQKKIDEFNDKYFPGHRQREAAHPYIPSPGARMKIMPETAQSPEETLRELLREAIEFSGEDGPGDDELGICYSCGEAVQWGHPHKDDCSYRNWLRRAQEAVKARERDPRKQLRKDKKPKKWPIPQFDQG